MRYPSDIVDQVLKLTPDSSLPKWNHEAPTHCSHCARPIDKGEHYATSDVGAYFSDTRNLACVSRVICWRCNHLRQKTLLIALGAAVVTTQGIYPISKDAHKAWLFTTPPKGPFLATHSSSTMQHLAWRTPITLDNQLIYIRFGPMLFTVRPKAINQALALADRANQDAASPLWKSPLILDRKAAAPNHGQLSKFGSDWLSPEDQQFLTSLSQGELWALSFLMHSKRPTPEQPQSITQDVLAKLSK